VHTTQMRAEWERMEQTGEAEDFVKGVGEVSRDEWEKLMRKLLERVLGKTNTPETNKTE